MNEEVEKTKLVQLDNEKKKKTKLKDICILQIVIAIYTLSTVCAKFASGQEFMSFQFILYYGIEMMILGVYAIIWQQLLKKFDVSIAYANKAMGLLWSIVWAILIFNDTITIKNVIGVLIVIIGTIIVNNEDESICSIIDFGSFGKLNISNYFEKKCFQIL